MSKVPVSRYVMIAKNWGEERNLLAGPEYADRPNLGFVHKAAGTKRFDDEWNDVQVFACMRIFYDGQEKKYYLLDVDNNRIYGNFFDPKAEIGVDHVIGTTG